MYLCLRVTPASACACVCSCCFCCCQAAPPAVQVEYVAERIELPADDESFADFAKIFEKFATIAGEEEAQVIPAAGREGLQ